MNLKSAGQYLVRKFANFNAQLANDRKKVKLYVVLLNKTGVQARNVLLRKK